MGHGTTVVVSPPVAHRPAPRAPRGRAARPSGRVTRPGSFLPCIKGSDRRTLAAVVALTVALAVPVTTSVATSTPAPALPAAAPFTGGPAGCTVKDPTSNGCVTPTTAHALAEIDKTFGDYRKGPTIRSIGCWDAHAWNPTSDHPRGKGCDVWPTGGKASTYASGDALTHGWEFAHWLRANAAALHVHYVIWQGRIWDSVERTGDDPGGWGRSYSGGGIYNARSATGGHFDHVHVSFTQ